MQKMRKDARGCIAYTEDGEFQVIFPSIRIAEREMFEIYGIKVDKSAISRCCNKLRHTHGVYNGKKIMWKWYRDK